MLNKYLKLNISKIKFLILTPNLFLSHSSSCELNFSIQFTWAENLGIIWPLLSSTTTILWENPGPLPPTHTRGRTTSHRSQGHRPAPRHRASPLACTQSPCFPCCRSYPLPHILKTKLQWSFQVTSLHSGQIPQWLSILEGVKVKPFQRPAKMFLTCPLPRSFLLCIWLHLQHYPLTRYSLHITPHTAIRTRSSSRSWGWGGGQNTTSRLLHLFSPSTRITLLPGI